MIKQLYNKRTFKYFQTDPHQIKAYEHLMNNKRSALFLGMSLSKTVIALSYLYEMHYREFAFSKTLVIAPGKVACITWPEEIETWDHLEGMRYSLIAGSAKERLKAMEKEAEIYVLSVDNFIRLDKRRSPLKLHAGAFYDCA